MALLRVPGLQPTSSLAAGEITDKAYVNQRAVLINRAAQMELIYSSEPCDQVIVLLEIA